jgi:predicted lipoprotein with Yx(FWY)xxD motif
MAGAGATLMLLAACGMGNSASGDTGSSSSTKAPGAAGHAVSLGKTEVGTVLVNGSGMTLYAFAADRPGKSNCTGSCLQYWPIVPAPAGGPKAATGVSAKLGTIKRSDGATQLTVNGWPMYTYVGDGSAGKTKGQGLDLSGGRWWVVSKDGSWNKTVDPSGGGGY